MRRLVALIVAVAFSSAPAAADECWQADSGVGVHIDNDILAGAGHDADYTGGFALQVTPREQSAWARTARMHTRLDRLLRVPRGTCRRHAWQLGLLAITPASLQDDVPVPGERPFASLLVFGTTATWNGSAQNTAWQSTLELGALGLEAAESVQDGVHALLGEERPRGYQYQVSEGGEPTFRYLLARHRLRIDRLVRGETLQTKTTAAVSGGYLTEVSVGWSLRWGRIDSPWQSFTPELADYLPLPTPTGAGENARELFVFAGARVKLRAYNALAQGQARDSGYRLQASELENSLGEAWAGVHWQPNAGWSATYTLRAQTPEVRDDPGRRALVWAGLSVSRRF